MPPPPGNAADEILPGLWLGNMRAAMDGEFLKAKQIEAVFNCTKDIPFHTQPKRRYRVPVDDNLEEAEIRNMSLWSFEIIQKLLHEMNQSPAVLVHCAAGMQRSACVVAMQLIAKQGMTTDQAMQFIQGRRPIAFRPSANFEKAIRKFEVDFDRDIRPKLLRS